MTWTQINPPSIGLPMQGQRAVTQNLVTVVVTLTTPITGNYDVWITPNWNTSWWCSVKTSNNFTVVFGTPAPAAASIDWRAE